MLFGTVFSLAVAGLASAVKLNFEEQPFQHQEDVRYVVTTTDAGSITKFLAELNIELITFDQIVADINKANVNGQMNKWVAQGRRLADVADRFAPLIKASGPVSMDSTNTLLEPGMKFFHTVNSTFYHLVERRQIILDAGLQNKVRESLVNGKHAMIAIMVALPSQLPAGALAQVEGIIGKKLPPLPTGGEIGPAIDRTIDYIFKVSI
jgi:hypothetical protein